MLRVSIKKNLKNRERRKQNLYEFIDCRCKTIVIKQALIDKVLETVKLFVYIFFQIDNTIIIHFDLCSLVISQHLQWKLRPIFFFIIIKYIL